MPVLLCPQQVSGSTDFQIPHGDLKSASQVGKLPNRMETLLSHFFEHFISPVHQKRIRRPVGSSDAPPELVEL